MSLSGPQWWFVMAMTALGFATMIAPVPLFGGRFGQFIPAVLYPAIPLIGLSMVAGEHWKAIFRHLKGRDIVWMVVFALLNMAVTLPIGWFISQVLGAEANPALAGLGDKTAPETMFFILKTAPSLFGEEVMSIFPFLGLMYLFFSRMQLSRKSSIVWAWLLCAVLFGAAHLPTYNWNWVQCLIVIGSARLVLTLAYIKTKSLWVSTGAHILNDWTFFALTLVGSSLAAK